MKNKKILLYSVAISLIAHVLFFAGSSTVKMQGVYSILDRSKRFFNIKSVEQELPSVKQVKKRGVTYADALKFESPRYSESLKSADLDKEREKKNLEARKEEMQDPIKAGKIEELDKLPLDETNAVKDARERQTRKELVELADLGGKEGYVSPRELQKEIELPEYFFDKMPGFTPEMMQDIDAVRKGIASQYSAKGTTSAVKRQADFTDLNEYLICGLATYTDPQDGKKYYRVSIRAGKDADSLPRIPKEIVFMADCSLSIQPERLDAFKNGLSYALNHLHPDDAFNVMAFKERIMWFRPQSVKPTKANINEALQFVGRLTAGEGTDAYKALYECIKVKENMIPSYIVLFSDGRPTYGVTNSRRIINEISNINQGKRPIFAFSGGLRVNRYFLDFISYKNRGWTEYATRTHYIPKQIAMMYEKIKDPILLNLRYRVSGLDPDQIFPKSLPDFYRNAEFTLYGMYEDESEFSLQLLGEAGDDEVNEFIVVGNLEEARQGDKDISRNWAFNKIYYLIGHLDGKDNKKTIDEINSLCNKFSITTPYSEGIKE